MAEKFIVTNYDHDDLISMIKEAFKEELKEILTQQEKDRDYDTLLSRKEVAELLKISLVTLHSYQKDGTLPFYRLGWHVYFRKGDIMKALEIPLKYHNSRAHNY
jgi:excisionase family DNA binding protein